MRNRRTIKVDRVVWALAIGISVLTAYAPAAHAIPDFLSDFEATYPAAAGTRLDVCKLCHSNVPARNSYGTAYSQHGFSFSAIEALDSDGDGFTNLAEITALTFPGDAADVPAASATNTPTPTATPAPPTPTPTPPATACAGDCNDDGQVTVEEIVQAVNIALGAAQLDICPVADTNGDGAVAVDDLVVMVKLAQLGCSNPG